MGQFRRGKVIDRRGSQVRVIFEDEDKLVSPWLDVGQRATVGRKSYESYAEGELVRVLMDDKGETGDVLHALYNDESPAPGDSAEVFYEEMPDGSVLTWEGGSFSYTNAAGTKFVVSGGDVTITGNLKVTGNLRTDGNLDLGGDLGVDGSTTLKDTTINGIPQTGN